MTVLLVKPSIITHIKPLHKKQREKHKDQHFTKKEKKKHFALPWEMGSERVQNPLLEESRRRTSSRPGNGRAANGIRGEEASTLSPSNTVETAYPYSYDMLEPPPAPAKEDPKTIKMQTLRKQRVIDQVQVTLRGCEDGEEVEEEDLGRHGHGRTYLVGRRRRLLKSRPPMKYEYNTHTPQKASGFYFCTST